jgi:protoheme ferro-lyase
MKDAEDLPKVFHEVTRHIPLVQNHFTTFKEHIVRSKPNEESIQAASALVKVCRDKAKRLEEIFDEVISSSDPAKEGQYRKFAKGDRLEDLMKVILRNVILLAEEPLFADVTSSQVDDLKKALSEMAAIPASLPEDETSYSFHNSGNGWMNVNTGTAPQNNNNNSSGYQFNGAIHSFHLPSAEPPA